MTSTSNTLVAAPTTWYTNNRTNQIDIIKTTDEEAHVPDIIDFFNILAKILKDITLSRHIFDYFKEFIKVSSDASRMTKSLGDSFDTTSNILKWASGAADMYIGINRIAENDFGTNENIKGILETIAGAGKIASAHRVPGADIVHGSAVFTSAVIDITQNEDGHNAVNYCRMFAGAFRTLSGVFREIKPLYPLYIPLGLYAGMFSLAGWGFKIHWTLGCLILVIGNVLNIVLLIPIKALLIKALTAFGIQSASVAASLAVTVVGIAAGLATLAVVGALIAETLRLEPPMPAPPTFASGGFPVCGLPFIAREAGPEIVGALNGRNAVINNDQIVEAVARGVHNAFVTAMIQQNTKSRYKARVFLNGEQIAKATAV